MGKSLNRVQLIGRLGKDPELKYTASGTPFCRFSMATSESWTDKGSGEKQESTEWHALVAWDRLAEICGQYLKKGAMVYIEGKLQTREWDDKEGVKRKTTEIVAKDMIMLGDKQGGGSQQASRSGGAWAPGGGYGGGGEITDDDIPFRSSNSVLGMCYSGWHETMSPLSPKVSTGIRVLSPRRNGRRTPEFL